MPSFSLEDLAVYKKAVDAAAAISALVDRRSLRSDPELRDQLRSSSGRVPSHIAEGHGQKTDKHFAHYLYIARGSAKEVRSHLRVATGRGYISEQERREHDSRFDELAAMLTGLIRHLETENRQHR